MSVRIEQALQKLFNKHRIVFWYDAKQELREDYQAVALPEVEKVEITNNEFWLKHYVLRQKPQQKFLLYKESAEPRYIDNWLLDIQLANAEFRTEQASIWLADLELGIEFSSLIENHSEFFNAEKRREALKSLHQKDDNYSRLQLVMLAVCTDSEPRLDAILEKLLTDLAEEKDARWRLIERCRLSEFFWQQIQRGFGYSSQQPSIKDFAIELFKSCMAQGLKEDAKLNTEAWVFLRRFKDSRQLERSFQTLSAEYANVLSIQQQLESRDVSELIELDFFELIDQKVISDLVQRVTERTVSFNQIALWIRKRKQGYWYNNYLHLYQAIEFAALFLQGLDEAALHLSSLTEAVNNYSQHWYKLDQSYRKFIYHLSQASRGTTLLQGLAEQIENLYTNRYLVPLANAVQACIDKEPNWQVPTIARQDAFVNRWVQPFLNKEHRAVVIISDALRFEIGHELLSLIRQEDRYSADITPALAMLPSYTQLGMAALLPHQVLSIIGGDSSVEADGQSTQGTVNRNKILSQAFNGRGAAIKAEDLLQLDRDASRELLKANDVLYVYHNRIDHTGDKIQSEGQAFEAAEKTLDDLLTLVKKLTAANANNILITADHGFIYQHRAIEESDFSSIEPKGNPLLFKNRRFVLGKHLEQQEGLKHFTAEQLGLVGDVEVQIPKSIQRLRVQGSGSRFVHGGVTLQEVVIPVVSVNKKRGSDVSLVDVEILRGNVATITTNQLAVTLYQKEPVSDKLKPRYLRIGLFNQQGELISDSHELAFDLTATSPRDREQLVALILSRKADSANGQEVVLRLDEKLAGTSHYTEYHSIRYLFKRSFTSDFDF